MTYAKGCTDYQKHGPMQLVPAIEMQLLVKPWPFRGWAMDLIGKINPLSSKGHHWIILVTDYFTKWVEAEEYVSLTHNTKQSLSIMDLCFEQMKYYNSAVIYKPRRWHETLSEALWAYRNSKRTSTGTTPYRFTFGHNAVLQMELNVKSARVALQHNLIPADYNEAMLAELEI
ncbi:uncharacterized protein LOC132314572 [Cornus florida]|uniref:uncharacterized protein LOC132314572 n=1 Tax=Cornus florida TaxID=4283 RepID=UPI00289C0015|nr:uncharacterized protein LOC132314572 [Cornus florida]